MSFIVSPINVALKTSLTLTGWLVIWGLLIALPVGRYFGQFFGYAEAVELTFLQCLSANAVRGILYLLLFAGISYIVGNGIKKLNECAGSIAAWHYVQVVGIVVLWVAFWTVVSGILYSLSASHFMGNCDTSDMECSCENGKFLYPLYILTSLLGCFYFARLYHQRKGRIEL